MYPLVFAIITERLLRNLSSLHIQNHESCRGTSSLFHFIASVSFVSISVFVLIFVVESTTCCGIEESLSIQSNIVVPKFLSGVSRSRLLQSLVINIANQLGLLQRLVINITGLVQFEKNLSYILSLLASKNYFLQSISVKLIVSIFMFQ